MPSDDLVKQRRRHSKAEGLCRLEINDQVVLGGRLHRQVSRLLTPEDAIDVAGRAPKLVEEIRPIREVVDPS